MVKYVRYFVFAAFATAILIGSCKQEEEEETPNDEPNGAVAFSSATTEFQKIFGGASSINDEQPGGSVINANEDMFFTLNLVDPGASHDLLLGKVSSAGSLEWTRVWDGAYLVKSPDCGQNAETGGSANSIAIDDQGYIYATASVSQVPQNNNFAVMVMKVDPSNGSIIWDNYWRHTWPSDNTYLASMSDMSYSLDVKNNAIYVTGATGSNTVFILALNTSDGSILFQSEVNLSPGYVDRGYCIKAGVNDDLYIAGLKSSYAFLLRLESVSSGSPVLSWAKEVNIGYGSAFNSMDIDPAGNIYLSCDRRGVTTYFTVLKVSNLGSLIWGKTYEGAANDRNNTNVVNYEDGYVYVGGRTSQPGWDQEMGDGLLVRINANTGEMIWDAMIYSGSHADTKAEHRVKGISVKGSNIYVYGQVYTGNSNSAHFSAKLYDGIGTLSSYTPSFTDIADLTLHEITTGEVRNAAAERTYLEASDLLKFQDAEAKKDGMAPDEDVFFLKLMMN